MTAVEGQNGTQVEMSDEDLIKLGRKFLSARQAKSEAQKRYRARRRNKGLKNFSLWSVAPTPALVQAGIVKPLVVYATEAARNFLKANGPAYIEADKNQLILKWRMKQQATDEKKKEVNQAK